MAAWLISALRLLGIGAGVGTGIELAGLGGEGIPFLPASLDPFESGRKPRRRRRRALSQGDRDDISFIAATINPTVAGKFAVALATRSR